MAFVSQVLLTADEMNALPIYSIVLLAIPEGQASEGVAAQKDGDGKWYLPDGCPSEFVEDMIVAAEENGFEFRARVLWLPGSGF